MSGENESLGSLSPVSDERLAAPATPAEEVVEDTTTEVEDDGEDLAIDGVEAKEEAIDAAQKAGEISKAQAQSMKKKLKLKVNGVEEDVEFDMNDEAALIRELQKSRAFDKTAKESAQFKSQVDQAFALLQQDPEAFMEKMGINVDDLAEKRINKRVEEMKKSPEQLEQEKLQKELEQLRQEKKAAEEARKKADDDRLRNTAAAQIENDITEALDAGKSFLPKKSPWVLRNISQYMIMAIQNGYPQVTAKDVLPLVEKKYQEEMAELFSVSSEDMMEKLIGKENLNRYRKSVISKKKAGPAAPNKPRIEDTGTTRKEEKQEEKPKYRMKDIFGYRTKS
jgi:hypothetical protein